MITANSIFSDWKLIFRNPSEKRIGVSMVSVCTEVYEMSVRGGNLIRTVETIVGWGSSNIAVSESVVFIAATVE